MEDHNYKTDFKSFIQDTSLKNFFGKTIVIKYGGNAMTEAKLKKDFAEDIIQLHDAGIKPVVVHGGGPQISAALKRLSIPEKFFNGIRATDIQTMQVVEWVLAGEVQQDLVRLMNLASKSFKSSAAAVGLTGNDGKLIKAKKIDLSSENDPSLLIQNSSKNQESDVGQVGEIISVDLKIIYALQANSMIPVISSVASNSEGEALNINADTLASAIACSLKAARLITMTNISGVLDENKNLVPLLTPLIVDQLRSKNALSGGILPKIQSALDAAKNGVNDVHIIDGREEHILLKSFNKTQSTGTLVRTN